MLKHDLLELLMDLTQAKHILQGKLWDKDRYRGFGERCEEADLAIMRIDRVYAQIEDLIKKLEKGEVLSKLRLDTKKPTLSRQAAEQAAHLYTKMLFGPVMTASTRIATIQLRPHTGFEIEEEKKRDRPAEGQRGAPGD